MFSIVAENDFDTPNLRMACKGYFDTKDALKLLMRKHRAAIEELAFKAIKEAEATHRAELAERDVDYYRDMYLEASESVLEQREEIQELEEAWGMLLEKLVSMKRQLLSATAMHT